MKGVKTVAAGAGVVVLIIGLWKLLTKPEDEENGAAPVPASLSGSVSGMVEPTIAGATVTINGFTTISGANGRYGFDDLVSGNYVITCVADGYPTVTMAVTLQGGYNTINILLTEDAVLYGTVWDYATYYALPGVTVTIQGMAVITGLDGRYEIAGLRCGTHTLTFQKAGYGTVSAPITLYIGDQDRSIYMSQVGEASLSGRVTNAGTGAPVDDVIVVLHTFEVVGDNLWSYTDALGNYLIAGIPLGGYMLTVTRSGYFDYIATVSIGSGANLHDIFMQPW